MLIFIREADIHLDALRSNMPPSPRQLALIIELGIRDIARMPAAVLFVAEDSQPQALEVLAGFGIDALHIAEEEILQHLLIGSL